MQDRVFLLPCDKIIPTGRLVVSRLIAIKKCLVQVLIQVFLTALTAYVLTRKALSAPAIRAKAAAMGLVKADIAGSPARTP